MQFKFILLLLLLSGCEIFPTSPDPNFYNPPDKTPVFEFDYVNSGTFPGWIRFQNHCTGITSYKWYLGIVDEAGVEITSFSSAPKVRYPQNGNYRVVVEGTAVDGTRFERLLQIEVSNY